MIVNCHPHHPHLKGMRPRKNKLAIVKKVWKKVGKKLRKKLGKKSEKRQKQFGKISEKSGSKNLGNQKER